MFTLLWSYLPVPRWAKVVLSVLLATGIIALLMLLVFPWVDSMFSDPTLGE